MTQEVTTERQALYFNLIDELLRCPNGKEPEILEAQTELLDADLIKTMLHVASIFVHEDNEDGAKFLIFVARELAKQLGLYPDISQTTINNVSTEE
jgi:hypothetical protein